MDPNVITIIPYSHYYWVGGPPRQSFGPGLLTRSRVEGLRSRVFGPRTEGLGFKFRVQSSGSGLRGFKL